MKLFYLLGGFLLAVIIFSSCAQPKPIQYLQVPLDTTKLSLLQIPDPAIQKGDLLSIIVFSDNPSASAIYNQATALPSSPSSTGGESSAIPKIPGPTGGSGGSGYLVNNDGDIYMVGVGRIHAEGMTKKQLYEYLENFFNKTGVLQHPAFDIRFLNYKVTLIGEVTRPGLYSIPTERVTILEALGLAGDLTPWAKRENVTIIREINGKREFGKLDLTSSTIFNSPYYYLQQNDVVMIDQNKRKAQAADQVTTRNISIITAIISTTAVVISLLRR